MIIELYAQIQNHKNNIGFWQQPLKINYVRVVSAMLLLKIVAAKAVIREDWVSWSKLVDRFDWKNKEVLSAGGN